MTENLDQEKPQDEAKKQWFTLPRRLMRARYLKIYLIVLLCTGGLFSWMSLIKTSTEYTLAGVVSPDGGLKVVEHMQAGIIADILVKNGDIVSEGQPLFVLNDIEASAGVEVLKNEKFLLDVTVLRILTEQQELASLVFPEWMLEQADQTSDKHQILDAQEAEFLFNRDSYEASVSDAQRQLSRIQQEFNDLESRIQAQNTALVLGRKELNEKMRLMNLGLFSRQDFLSLQRRQTNIQDNIARYEDLVLISLENLDEAQGLLSEISTERQNQLALDLEEASEELNAVEQQLTAGQEALIGLTVSSPDAGIVVDLRLDMIGATVLPGEPVFDLVLSNSRLLIDVHLSNLDIVELHNELAVNVVFSGYEDPELPQINGSIETISSDVQIEESTLSNDYLMRVEVKNSELNKLGDKVDISSGLTANVHIAVEDLSLLKRSLRYLNSLIH